jgi:hypothetical protein
MDKRNSSEVDGIVDYLRLDERQKNKSTSCLVYVPSDPWTKMDGNEQVPVIMTVSTTTKGKKGSNRMKKLMDVKSQSKPDLIDDNFEDPWVVDEARKKHAMKTSTYRNQSKSLHIDTKSGTARPRLQRSKSPQDPLSSLSPTLGYHCVPDGSNKCNKNAVTTTSMTKSNGRSKTKIKQQQFLNVSNPNLLQQSRHSFSTSPTSLTSTKSATNNNISSTKDDELTLNIRRLSEQIKYSSTYASYGNFSPTSPKTPKQDDSTDHVGMEKSASLLSDSLLETTC